MSADALEAAIAGELGSLDALDGFVERPGRPAARALPAGDVVIVASETTIGVALAPAAFALCAGCTVTVRDRGDGLFAAFAQTLAQEEPALAAHARAVEARAYDDPAWLTVLRAARVVVAFGRAAALRALRAETAPEATFVAFGHRTSVAYVAREALASQAGARACTPKASHAMHCCTTAKGACRYTQFSSNAPAASLSCKRCSRRSNARRLSFRRAHATSQRNCSACASAPRFAQRLAQEHRSAATADGSF